ncbi:hypothetical protein RJ639_039399 [Escallonia herrerae]|uniref:RING-type domain-containing protein n=1 Tax=Escallonia herrerae TaxID=1293975 RepID=A0AA89B7Z6_9ASTE|nr:hypothetical protein RJ639_039399 [Escallonia herrerae]
MKRWVSPINYAICRSKEAVRMWVFPDTGIFLAVMKKTVTAFLTCILALAVTGNDEIEGVLLLDILGGATVGTITGAMKGQTTESGLLRGATVGAVAGAITAVQLMELVVNGERFSKVALLRSLVNGKVFMEWVSPAVLKAYQWQISAIETGFREISDIFEVNGTKGLSQDSIKKLPIYKIYSTETMEACHETSCAICLRDFKDGDDARKLPSCTHSFHLDCIDEWLTRHASCPMCREDV